jgi:hypothetical protein
MEGRSSFFCSKENETERGSNALKREKKRVGRPTFDSKKNEIECGSNAFKREKRRVGRHNFVARRTKRNVAAMHSRGRKRG